MPDRLSIRLIRLYCDGELAPEEAAEVERAIESSFADRAAVEGELMLRRRLAEAMSGHAPAGLAGQIRQAMAASAGPAESHQPADPAGERSLHVALSRSSPVVPRRRFLSTLATWSIDSQRVNVFAVAACLMLVAAAVLVGIFGSPIDKLGKSPRKLTIDAVRHVSKEHLRCLNDGNRLTAKIARGKTPEAARALISDHLGLDVLVPDLTGIGYQFVGGGPCGVPGHMLSAHLIYSRSGADGSTVFLSIFMEPNTGQFKLPRDERFPVEKDVSEGRMWADAALVYFLLSSDDAATAAAYPKVREQLAARGR